MSGITNEEVSSFHLINHTMKSHKRLSLEDIRFASNYICSFYYYSKRLNPNPFDEDKLILFLTYTHQKGICRFALSYNADLDKIIISRDKIKFRNFLLNLNENVFIELYNNAFLSEENKQSIEKLVAKEFYGNKLTLELIREKLINAELIDDSCGDISVNMKQNKSGHLVGLAKQCYENVCIQDSKTSGWSDVDSILSKHDCSPSEVYTVDGSVEPMIYCFDTLHLLDIITDKIPINPITNQPFSSYALKLINRRFHKEISMYRRYKQLKMAK